jgi:hypothetical protein
MTNKMQAELNHLGGEGVVVKTYYADPEKPGVANVYTSLPGVYERELWQETAFTNGGPLVKIEIIWSPKEAAELTARKEGQGGGA